MKRLKLLVLLMCLPFMLAAQQGQGIWPEVWKQEYVAFQDDSPKLDYYSNYNVLFCKLDLHLERDTVYVEGNVTTSCISNISSLSVYHCELIPELIIDSVLYNGNLAVVSRAGDLVSVELFPAVNMGQHFTVQVFYHGDPVTANFWSGISSKRSPIWGNEVTWTLSQPANAKQWWPCKQDLQDKIDSAWIFITTDTSSKAGSNGLLSGITPMPGGKHRYEWKTIHPVEYYLISASVADYQEYIRYAHPQGTADSVLIQHYIYDAPGCLDHYRWDLNNTGDFLEWFSRLFGLYPFSDEKYGHCQVELAGGMEHQTMGSLGDFNFHLISHELAHQWFGDYVTCKTWNDIWVNEGFATYCQYLALQYIASQAYADTFMMGVHQYVMSAPGGSVYIPQVEADDETRIFDGRLSYNKGAAILHALRGEMNNDSLFFGMLRKYLKDFGHGVATGLDVRDVAQEVSGLDFTDFFDQWYFGQGFPVLSVLWSQAGDSLYLNITQRPSSTTSLFRMHLEFRLIANPGDTIIRLYLDRPSNQLVIPVHRKVEQLVADPRYWNLFRIQTMEQINREELPGLFLFPNPCRETVQYLFQSLTPVDGKAVLTDLQGRNIRSFTLRSGWGTLYTGDLSAGVYLVCPGKDTSFQTVKLVVD